MLKNKTRLFIAFILISKAIFAQNPLEDEKPVELSKWQSAGWRIIQDFSISPISKKVRIVEGVGAILTESMTELKSPEAHQTYLISFEYNADNTNQSEIQLNAQTKVSLNRSNFGTLNSNGLSFTPETNAIRAEGLWNKIELSIEEAPNQSDKLLLNYLKINEVIVLQHIIVNNPKQADNRLVFKNNTGKLALKNVKVIEQTTIQPLTLKNINAEVWYDFNWEKSSADGYSSKLKATIPNLHFDVGQEPKNKNHIIKYKADLVVDKAGIYNIAVDYAGKLILNIDGKPYSTYTNDFFNRKRFNYKVELSKGTHQFYLEYLKVWWRPALGVFVSGNGAKTYALHETTSLPDPKSPGKMLLNPSLKTEIIRGFYMHNGIKNTTAMAVGFPSRTNYAIDLNKGSLMTIWKGNYIDVQEMWYDRGEPQTFEADGMKVEFASKEILIDQSNQPIELDFKGYQVDANNAPTFNYKNGSLNLKSSIVESEGGLQNTLSINEFTNKKVVLGRANSIEKVEKNLFKLGQHYIKIDAKLKPEIVSVNNENLLVVPAQSTISYTILW